MSKPLQEFLTITQKMLGCAEQNDWDQVVLLQDKRDNIIQTYSQTVPSLQHQLNELKELIQQNDRILQLSQTAMLSVRKSLNEFGHHQMGHKRYLGL